MQWGGFRGALAVAALVHGAIVAGTLREPAPRPAAATSPAAELLVLAEEPPPDVAAAAVPLETASQAPSLQQGPLSADAPAPASRRVVADSLPDVPEGDGVVNVEDVGDLLASLKRRPKLPGGFAHLADRGDAQTILRPPYPLVSDGRLDRDEILRLVRSVSGRVRACTRDARALAGHVAVTVRIGRRGEVTAAEDSGGDVDDADVRACVVAAFRALHFSEPERGAATFTYPVKVSLRD
jgi:hypothetical protein